MERSPELLKSATPVHWFSKVQPLTTTKRRSQLPIQLLIGRLRSPTPLERWSQLGIAAQSPARCWPTTTLSTPTSTLPQQLLTANSQHLPTPTSWWVTPATLPPSRRLPATSASATLALFQSPLVRLSTQTSTPLPQSQQARSSPAQLSGAGVLQLSDSTTSTSTSLAATANAVKVTKDVADAALPVAGGTLTGEVVVGTTATFKFEGATADNFETTLAVVDPTADRTVTFQDASGTVAFTSQLDDGTY